jgi:hypothetical protein
MTLYVHAPGVPNIYHWCRNCSKYPKPGRRIDLDSSRGEALQRVRGEGAERNLPHVNDSEGAPVFGAPSSA